MTSRCKAAFCYEFRRWLCLDFKRFRNGKKKKKPTARNKKGCLTVQQVGSEHQHKLIAHTLCTQYSKTKKYAFGFKSNFLLIHLINTSDLADLTLGGVCEPGQAGRRVCVYIEFILTFCCWASPGFLLHGIVCISIILNCFQKWKVSSKLERIMSKLSESRETQLSLQRYLEGSSSHRHCGVLLRSGLLCL